MSVIMDLAFNCRHHHDIGLGLACHHGRDRHRGGIHDRRRGLLVTATVGALIVFGLATTIYAAATAKGGANWSNMPQNDWTALHSVTVPSLLAYAIVFAVAIGILNLVRSIVLR